MPIQHFDSFHLAYDDQGQGPVLLLLHGFTGTARGHLGALIDHFSTAYRVIAPDLRGYGGSRPPIRDFPKDFYQRDADDVAALLRAIGCGPVVVLGFSDGAESALLLAARHPELVRAVVAWGVCGIISPQMAAAVDSWLPVEAWGESRAAWRDEIIAWHGAEQLVPMISGWVHAAHTIANAGGDIALGSAHLIACPTLLVNGEHEVGNPLADVQRLAARIAGCRLEIVADAGHSVHTDQPERFLALIEAFIESATPRQT